MQLSMHRLAGTFAVHRLPPDSALPAGLFDEPFVAVVRSEAELSVCCRSDVTLRDGRREDGWVCLAVDGPLDFTLTGIVSAITRPLAGAGITVFVMSSFDTDYVMVKQAHLARTAEVLEGAGIRLKLE